MLIGCPPAKSHLMRLNSYTLQAALASSLVSQRPENTMYRVPGTAGQPAYSLPLTNLARMSADAVMGGSYFSHQIGRNSFETMLDAPYGQHTALNRRSADASLPAGRNMPPPRCLLLAFSPGSAGDQHVVHDNTSCHICLAA